MEGSGEESTRSTGGNVMDWKAFLGASSPRWLLLLLGALLFSAVVWGGWTQSRAWRYGSLLKASKVRIAELEANTEMAKLQVTRTMGTKAIQLSEEKVKVLDQQLEALKKRQVQLRRETGAMTPKQLKEAFDAEGF